MAGTNTPKIFTLTVDVEIDAGRKWKTSKPATYEGVTQGVTTLQRLCDAWGVLPTYFVSPAVMVDTQSVDILGSLDPGRCELGSHLHGEYLPPGARYAGPDFSGCDPGDMQCLYRRDVEKAKLENLTAMFVDRFGYQPLSFRAGRFAARGYTLSCLEQLGYTHDSSVTPYRNWYDKVDFSNPCSLAPYHPSRKTLCRHGRSRILEVPVSITPDLEWLRPTPRFADFDRCRRVIDWYEANTEPTVLCCMFHNVELVPGKSPYCSTQADCDGMLAVIERLFELLTDRGYRFSRMRDVTLDG